MKITKKAREKIILEVVSAVVGGETEAGIYMLSFDAVQFLIDATEKIRELEEQVERWEDWAERKGR